MQIISKNMFANKDLISNAYFDGGIISFFTVLSRGSYH